MYTVGTAQVSSTNKKYLLPTLMQKFRFRCLERVRGPDVFEIENSVNLNLGFSSQNRISQYSRVCFLVKTFVVVFFLFLIFFFLYFVPFLSLHSICSIPFPQNVRRYCNLSYWLYTGLFDFAMRNLNLGFDAIFSLKNIWTPDPFEASEAKFLH